MASGGTLLLDEVGNVSMKTQMDLLRVLETKQFTRVGGDKTIDVDFRIICATNKNLEYAIEEGTFREDFYYRLNVFTILIPPLRERPADIPPLAAHFVHKYALSMNKNITEISPEGMAVLVQYKWPGNVRELANAIERALVIGAGPRLKKEDLPIALVQTTESPTAESLAAVEKAHIQYILEKTEWNITQAANTLAIDRVTLYNKIKKYELKK
jgi:transcriptional regulator with PAS, ATPase and Fis domain